ncbi:hypothetical protein ACHAWF_018763 [Thalassiosira exigua]
MFKDFIEVHLGFIPPRVDRDTYYRINSKLGGTHYYELLLVYLDDVLVAWSLLSTKYAQAAVENLDNVLREEGREFKTGGNKVKTRNPIPSGYKSELDTTEECDVEHDGRFQQLIGILRWAVELGRVDIHIEVALMSQYSANPRVGHLEAVYCIFHYLKCNPVKQLVMDPVAPRIDRTGFNGTANWA